MTRRELAVGALAFAAPEPGWRSLFDGKTFHAWRDPSSMQPAGDSWSIEEGSLVATREPQLLEDLETKEDFQDFEFSFEWKLAEGGNSGVKYSIGRRVFLENSEPGWAKGKRVEKRQFAPGTRGQQYLGACEFQLIDDEKHPDAARGTIRKTGALYGLVAPQQPANAPAGIWHQGQLKKQGLNVEHWVNGKLVLATRLDSPEIAAKLSAYPVRLAEYRASLEKRSTIALQNHGDSAVWFRYLRVKDN